MNKRYSLLAIAVLVLAGCQFVPQSSDIDKVDPTQQAETQISPAITAEWLDYADPKAEANFAIQKQDFQLLTLGHRDLSIPGVDLNNNDLNELKQLCGLRLVADSDDELSGANNIDFRKKLVSYAAQYNQLVLSACRTK